MHYSTEIKKNLSSGTFFTKQAGVSSLLFIVLVGLSLTVLTVGYMSSMRSLQSSATTTHAQTQAQMQAMIGYQALTKYLKKQLLTNIDKITTGSVSSGTSLITFKRISCGTNLYCFDITGQSGGASAILRAQYAITNELSTEQLKGSIFEGGLKVNKLDNLTASDVTLEIGGGKIVDMGNNATPYTEDQLKQAGIKVIPYTQRDFISPAEARKYANYIFYREGSVSYCKKNNYFNSNTNTRVTTESSAELASVCATGVSWDTDKWIINSSLNLPAGVLWFDNNVEVRIHNSAVVIEENQRGVKVDVRTDNPNNILVNSIISKNHINSTIVELNGSYVNTFFEAYAPHHYVLSATSDTERTARLKKICPANYPIQYCESEGVLKSTADMEKMPASISNILYLAQTLQLSGGKDQKNIHVNYYGNLMANSTAGGTGGSSGKLVGTGTVKIEGNLMVVGGTDMTEMTGDFKLNLSKADDPGNFVPVYKKTFAVGGIRYM